MTLGRCSCPLAASIQASCSSEPLLGLDTEPLMLHHQCIHVCEFVRDPEQADGVGTIKALNKSHFIIYKPCFTGASVYNTTVTASAAPPNRGPADPHLLQVPHLLSMRTLCDPLSNNPSSTLRCVCRQWELHIKQASHSPGEPLSLTSSA